jgi:hypothetical protein
MDANLPFRYPPRPSVLASAELPSVRPSEPQSLSVSARVAARESEPQYLPPPHKSVDCGRLSPPLLQLCSALLALITQLAHLAALCICTHNSNCSNLYGDQFDVLMENLIFEIDCWASKFETIQ